MLGAEPCQERRAPVREGPGRKVTVTDSDALRGCKLDCRAVGECVCFWRPPVEKLQLPCPPQAPAPELGAAASWLRQCWPEPFLEATSLPSGLHCPRPQPLKPSLMGAQRPRRSTPPQDCPLGQFKTRPLEKSGRWDLPGGPVVKTSPSSAGAVVQSES